MERVKRNTKRKGDISELRVMHDLVRAGYLVSIPFGEDHRYDVVIWKNGVFKSVQVKTGRLRNGVIFFNSCSRHDHRGGSTRPYTGEVDYFGIYCPDVGSTYLVPVADVPLTTGSLRLSGAKNGQRKKLRWAEQYALCAAMDSEVVVGKGVASAVAPLALELPS